MDIGALHFQNPEAFWLLVFVPVLIALYVYRQRKRKSTIKFPALSIAKRAVPSRRVRLRHIVPALRLAALCCFVVALARPQNAMEVEYTNTDGVDIMLALDVSGSMGTLDMLTRAEQAKLGVMNAERILNSGEYWKYSRMGYAQGVIADFIQKRHSDRIGLSAFGSRAVTQCPLTLDYGSLLEILKATDELAKDSIIAGRTAIGDGLMNALARLQKSEAKSKVVVLLTDGRDNASVISPVRAADVAQSLGVKVYTVGVGKRRGKILAFQQNPWTGEISWGERDITPEEEVDESTLKEVAAKTGGKFYRAENKEQLEEIYSEIDQLEKTEIETVAYARYAEKFYPWLLAGAFLILLELLLANTRFVRIP
ncbi:vWA domain-containing protein [Fibrobacter sp.]|jgi:Ca-activated chloride channel family protein|uniref:vWA domain-containing protein n=1 Tax=Fibrobacter sp. TaxID=35828 RepID=UPI0025C1E6F3|nr:VWA domain-containing protein [Fibrobacter sp.]MBR2057568.1 VWA domain-containing protein [Fibrobacter sp.]MBR2308059.1 VWA domain-containing protein [Fibrobacter sp.]MBR4007626.1 VWA domain-containing protein [Fibrobacter sp.]